MKIKIDKLLVIITTSIVVFFSTTAYFIDLVIPKHINIEDGLSFGNKNAKVEVVFFEDFKCKYCKKYSLEIFPEIKEKYIDTDKIHYMIIPLAFIYGSKLVANAAIAIYELKKDQFFKFLKIISEKKAKVETKQELIEIAALLQGINLQLFEEFLENKVFNEYLKNNIDRAEKIMPSFEVPSAFVNGYKTVVDGLDRAIEENIKSLEYNYD